MAVSERAAKLDEITDEIAVLETREEAVSSVPIGMASRSSAGTMLRQHPSSGCGLETGDREGGMMFLRLVP
jgi:hypothetical protein